MICYYFKTSDIALYVSNKHVKFGVNPSSSFDFIGNYILSAHNTCVLGYCLKNEDISETCYSKKRLLI